MSLEQYQAKRRFDQTPEPQAGQGSGPLRFVVQKHAASHLHYDFRLEMGSILKSWAVPKGPSLNPHDKRLAMMTEDHPYDYRTFEGIIPEGNYGAGTVMVWDEGTYEPVVWDKKTGVTLHLSRQEQDKAARHSVHAGHLTFILRGQKLNGEFALIKMHDAEENAWLLVKADKDDAVTTKDVTKQDRSALSGRTLDEIAKGGGAAWTRAPGLSGAPPAPLPDTVAPMLATLAEAPFDDPDWLYEIKWDGYRAIATITPEGVKLRSRRDQDFAAKYPPVTSALQDIRGATAVLDGEIVVLDDQGRSVFEGLQTYADTAGTLVYYVFDLLYLDGHDLTGLPLTRRKQILRDWLPPSGHVRYSDHVNELGTGFFAAAKQQNLEGIMAKDGRSRYTPGKRSHSWFKIKTHARQEAVIGGYTAPRGSRSGFGALVLGVYDEDGQLHYIGHTGGGFDERSIADTLAKLEPLRQPGSPFAETFKTNAPATWVKPKLVAEVEFREWTDDGHMRQPIFLGLRPDKSPKSVHRETAVTPPPETKPLAASTGTRRAPIHHPDKVFWPDDGITKGELAAYYQAIAPTLLPYLKDRPESLNRFPHGIAGDSFYQKNVEDAPDWVRRVTVHSDSENHDVHYVVCDDLDTLLYLVNLGCIELNPWNSRIQHPEHPDWAVIDLDPEDVSFDTVVEVAQMVHQVLESAGIPHYPKTSGATGLHIYIPMDAQYTYDQVKNFAHINCQLVGARLPDVTSLERSPAKRQQRVYLDYLQNRRGQTLAAAYAVRPRPGATVSTPLHWDEVKPGLDPKTFTIHTMPARLQEAGDLWQPVIGPGVDLLKALKHLDA